MACGGGETFRRITVQDGKRKVASVNLLECRVCNDTFTLQGTKVPRLLYCGHSFCHECLSKLSLHDRALRCPLDRQPTSLGDSGVWGLKKNFALLELLERLETNKDASQEQAARERRLFGKKQNTPCDEQDEHFATTYCTVCNTHLCDECAMFTHSTRTLARHKLVPLSEKPRENPVCSQHPPHVVEFACIEPECATDLLMCFVCKDYGKHKGHKSLSLEKAAENTRSSMMDAIQHVRPFVEEMYEASRRLREVIQQIEGGVQVIEDLDGGTDSRHVPGTADMSRSKVRCYFQELHEMLQRQQEVALSVLDAHVRERLHFLRQYQEEFGMMVCTLSSMSTECEKRLQEDDAKILIYNMEVTAMLDTLQCQQQEFAAATERICLDPSIPVTFTKDNRVHIGPKMEMRVVVLGLDGAGKTTILIKLKENEVVQTTPTIGFNVETVEYRNLNFTIWDVGGDTKLRPLWKHYYLNTQALIFVVDSADTERFDEALEELSILMSEKQLKDALLLIFANKQDVPNAVGIDVITEKLALQRLCYGRNWLIQPCNAKGGEGLWEGLEWLSQQLVAAGVMDLA